MRLADEAQHAGDGDVSVADALAEPERRRVTACARSPAPSARPRPAPGSAKNPALAAVPCASPAVEQADRLVPGAGRGARSQMAAALGTARGDHRLALPGQLVEMVEDRLARSALRRCREPGSAPVSADCRRPPCRRRRRSTRAGVRSRSGKPHGIATRRTKEIILPNQQHRTGPFRNLHFDLSPDHAAPSTGKSPADPDAC